MKMTNKIVSELTLKKIHSDLRKFGFELTDEQFSQFSYSELRKLYRKGEKAYNLRIAVLNELHRKFEQKGGKS